LPNDKGHNLLCGLQWKTPGSQRKYQIPPIQAVAGLAEQFPGKRAVSCNEEIRLRKIIFESGQVLFLYIGINTNNDFAIHIRFISCLKFLSAKGMF